MECHGARGSFLFVLAEALPLTRVRSFLSVWCFSQAEVVGCGFWISLCWVVCSFGWPSLFIFSLAEKLACRSQDHVHYGSFSDGEEAEDVTGNILFSPCGVSNCLYVLIFYLVCSPLSSWQWEVIASDGTVYAFTFGMHSSSVAWFFFFVSFHQKKEIKDLWSQWKNKGKLYYCSSFRFGFWLSVYLHKKHVYSVFF